MAICRECGRKGQIAIRTLLDGDGIRRCETKDYSNVPAIKKQRSIMLAIGDCKDESWKAELPTRTEERIKISKLMAEGRKAARTEQVAAEAKLVIERMREDAVKRAEVKKITEQRRRVARSSINDPEQEVHECDPEDTAALWQNNNDDLRDLLRNGQSKRRHGKSLLLKNLGRNKP